MTKYSLKIVTSGPEGTIVIPFNTEHAANESLEALQVFMKTGAGLYSFPGITTLDTSEVTGLSVVPYEDE